MVARRIDILRFICLTWLVISSDAGIKNIAFKYVSSNRTYNHEKDDVFCVSQDELEDLCMALPSAVSNDEINLIEERTSSSLSENALSRVRRRRNRRSQTKSKSESKTQIQTEVGADPFTIAVVATGVFWATMYLVQIATKSLSMRWLKQKDQSNRDTIALAVKETCHFVSQVYDRLRFQKHAVLSVLQIFARDEDGFRVKLTSNTPRTHPEFTSWIEFLRELEYSMLTFYKMFGEDTLCPIFKEPPEFDFLSVSTMSEFGEDVNGDDEEENDEMEVRFRPPRKCAPQVIVEWVRKEEREFGRVSWEEERREYCAMSDEDLMRTWNEEWEWQCELEEIRRFKITNCHVSDVVLDESEDDLSTTASSSELEDDHLSSASSSELEEDHLSTASSRSHTSATSSETPWWGARLSLHALNAIQTVLRPFTSFGLLREETMLNPPPHTLTSDSCRVFGSESPEQCREIPSCSWNEVYFSCDSSTASIVESDGETASHTESSPSPSPHLTSMDEEESELASSLRPVLEDDIGESSNPITKSKAPSLPSSFSSKVSLSLSLSITLSHPISSLTLIVTHSLSSPNSLSLSLSLSRYDSSCSDRTTSSTTKCLQVI